MAIDFNLIYKSKALRDMGFGIGDVIYETGCIFTKYTKWPWMTPGSCYETNAEGEVWVEDETDVVYSRYGPEFCTDSSGLQRRGYAPEEDWPDWAIFPIEIDFDLIYRSKALRDMGFTIGDRIWETGDIFSDYTKWPWMTPGSCYETNAKGEVWTEDETDVVFARYGPEFCD
jgi:hypothetical protein